MDLSQKNPQIREVNSDSASKGYSSNKSQFQSTFKYQYPIEKKNEHEQSINSEQSLSSIQEVNPKNDRSQYDEESQMFNYNYDQIINQNQRLESQNISLQAPINQQQIDLQTIQDQEPIQKISSPVKLQQQQLQQSRSQSQVFQPFQPYQQQQISASKSRIDRSFDGISVFTNISKQRTTPNSRNKANSFYYDRIGNQVSEIMPPMIDNYLTHVLLQTALPLLIVFILYVINYFLQRAIDQFCYLPEQYCICNGFGAKLWSWARQLIMWKLGLIVYRKQFLCRLAMGSSNLKHKEPVTEYIFLFLFTIIFDFILVIWIENNQDYVYVILVYCIGVVVLLNTFRVKDWDIVFKKGAGVFLYDFALLMLMVFIYYAVPNVVESLQDRQGKISGMQSFLYLYPLFDWIMEMFMDYIYNQTQFAELYIYQLQLIILGMKIGILNIVDIWTFEFWYNILMLGIMRANNSSMFLTIFLRRWVFYLIPDLQFITKMSETKKSLKGKHGAYLEHQFWIVFYYFFYLTNSSVPYIAKKTVFISNCKFDNETWNLTREYYQPIFVWGLLLIAEIAGIMLNKQKKYDNIKYEGGCKFNLIGNIFIRLSGYYFFQIAVMIPFLFKSLNDISQINKHLETKDTEQY
ncbi:unnamed protein product [Paramecium pentaurelia]|uniref:Transmembrane protein n=1 Tax=Paramecium pentaurelia TaxID=43138 RepID=A0A8S1V5B4_9CILI|nr:unnamed protein product [Paramecium pentaurelia]